MNQFTRSSMGTVIALAALGCGDGGARSHEVPWNPEGTRVVEADRSVVELDTPEGEDCLDLGGEFCVMPQEVCAGQAAEVILDADGSVLEVVCYPEEGPLSVEEIEAQDGNVAQNQNNAVIVLDGADDGPDITGDVSVDANNVVIYGDDPATAVVAGDMEVDGNNIIVRGVRIQGDVAIIANNAVFLHCVIDGNVSITGNNAVLTACDVFGNVEVTGQNARLSGNHIAGELSSSGQNAICTDNVGAADADQNGVLDASELGEPLTCE